MNRQKLLFLVFVVLAVAWTGLLGYLAATIADPVVVSAPQLQLSTLVVAAEVKPAHGGLAEAKIVKVFKDDSRPPRQGEMVTVRWKPTFDLPGQGIYLLALSLEPGSGASPVYVVTPIYVRKSEQNPEDARVYPYTDSVRIQVERIVGR